MALADNEAIISVKVKDDTAGADKAEKNIKEVGDATDEAGKKAEKASFNFKEFAKNAGLGATAIFGAAGAVAKMALDSASVFEQQNIAFTTLLGDSGKAQEAIKNIEVDAKATPFNLPDLIKANQLLISSGESAGGARDVIKDLGNAVAATGGSTPELLRMAQNLQQIKALGKASAVDVKQFGMAGINIYKLLAEASGLPIEQVKDMEVTYEDLTNALKQAGLEGGMFENAMENQSKSLQGTISNIQDAIGIGLKDLAMDTGLFDAVKNGAQGLLSTIEAGIPTLTTWITNITANKDAMVILTGVVLGLAAAMFFAFITVAGPVIIATLTFAAAGAALTYGLNLLWPVIATVTGFLNEHRTVLAFLAGLIGTVVVNQIRIMITSLIQWAIVQTATVIPAIIGTIIAMGPLILTAIAVGAVVALLYTAWKNNWLGMRDALKPIVDSILGILKPVIDFIGKIIEGIKKLAGIKGSGVDAGGIGDYSTDLPSFSGGNLDLSNASSALGGTVPNFSSVPASFNPGTSNQINVTNNNFSQVDLNASMRELGFDIQTIGG